MRLTILHSNDIHGRQEQLAGIATLVRRERETAPHPVLYLDAGDVEDSTNPLSNATRGTAMHRLLARAGCDAATVGNAVWIRHGVEPLAEHARVGGFPQLLANFEGVEGPVPFALFGEVGVFGLSTPFRGQFESVDFGFRPLDELECARRCCVELRARGARLVVLLSHLGLDVPYEEWDDRRLAAELQDEIDLIVGAHTHDLLPEGERIGRVLVVQAGEFGNHLGRVEVDGERLTASVAPVGDVEPDPGVLAEIAAIESELEVWLSQPVGEAREPVDAAWVAAMLRERHDADVGLFVEGLLDGTLPAGPVTRGALRAASPSANNPGVAELSGAMLRDLLARGGEPAFVAERPRFLRGRCRGRLHVAGLDPAELDDARTYRVASTDLVLERYGGYALPEWRLAARFEFPLTIGDAIEERLRG